MPLPAMPLASQTVTSQSDAWIAALIFLGLSAAVASSLLLGSRLLRVKPKSPPPDHLDTYECGEEPDGEAWIRFHPRYYLVALVFVVFDAEAAFLLPWSLRLHETAGTSLGWWLLGEMGLFLGILVLGWWWALRKGALRWQ